MLKKILCGAAILAATNLAVANPAPYLGAGLGVDVNSQNNAVAFRGMPFDVFAGYGGVINENFYLAGELDLTVATAQISDNGYLKTTYSYGVSVIPGLMLSDHTLGFIRLGLGRTHFDAANYDNQTSGTFGIGLQTSVTQNVDVRGEYNYVAYNQSPRTDAFKLALVYKFD